MMDYDISQSRAWNKLEKLGQRPYDLTSDEALSHEDRLEMMRCNSVGLKMLYFTQRVTEEVIDAFQEFADEQHLVKRYKEMRRGAVINRIEGWDSENRQVLHTASRDIFSDNPAAQDATVEARNEFAKLSAFLEEIESGKLRGSSGETFTNLVNIGIGGSDLGPRAIYEALKAYNIKGRQAQFIANVDPDDAAQVLDATELSRTLVVVVSKSGTTLETLTNEELVRRAFMDAGLNPERHFVAVTGLGSPMDNPKCYLRSFYMFDYIGGRYSVTSMVGCVMLGFVLGMEQLAEFLRGAQEMDVGAEAPEIRTNMPLLLALLGIWNHNILGYPTVAVLPYSQPLHRFTAHLQQCDMESNGKSVTRGGTAVRVKTGPVVWGEPGTNGQHAFYQLLHQGTEIVPAEFIGFVGTQRDSDITVNDTTSQQKLFANLLAQSVALAVGQDAENPNRRFSGNRPSSIIIGDQLDPVNMGRLLALYEAKIVFQGFCWQINSFDQEGVQLGKVLATRFLEAMKSSSKTVSTIESRILRVLEK